MEYLCIQKLRYFQYIEYDKNELYHHCRNSEIIICDSPCYTYEKKGMELYKSTGCDRYITCDNNAAKYLIKMDAICINTSISLAIKKDRLDALKYIISCGFKSDRAVCLYAARLGKLRIVKYLIKIGYGSTFLLAASCESGKLDLVKYLLGKSGSSDTIISRVENIAITHGHLNIVKYLSGIKTEGYLDNNIRIAIKHNNLDMVKILINRSWNHNEDMFCAITNGHLDIVKFIVSMGIRYNKTFINEAARLGHAYIVDYLSKI